MKRLLAALVMAALTACNAPPDEEQILATIDAMEAAAEAGDKGGFLDHVASDFSGQGGAVNKEELGRMLNVQLLRHTRVSAVVSDPSVELFGDRATATMRVLVTGGSRAWIPESGRLLRVETAWKRDSGEWRLMTAHWENLAGS